MNVLLINPRYPDTYWSFKHALKFISKRSVNIPLGLITVAGGPLVTEEFDQFPELDHLVLNEAEITLPEFIEDWNKGTAQKIYQTTFFADLKLTPAPDYFLLHPAGIFLPPYSIIFAILSAMAAMVRLGAIPGERG